MRRNALNPRLNPVPNRGRPGIAKVAALALVLPLGVAARADVGWSVSFDDPAGAYASFEPAIASNLIEAGNAWGSYLVGNATIDVRIRYMDGEGANGGSATSVYEYTRSDGVNVFQEGAATEIIAGYDPNGADSDIVITLGKEWMDGLFWWDPSPGTRTDPVPGNRLDGLSVLMHEVGHGLAFNGWLNGWNGRNPGYMSRYDELISLDGANLFFNGPQAMAVYGGPVPLTYGNCAHYGNSGGRPGEELAGVRLMNGVSSLLGYRWNVTDLDLAFLADTGYTLRPTPVPEPTSLAALAFGMATIRCRRRRAVRPVGG